MTAGKKLRISQCLIVKNEESNIERALSWGKDIMWEQIVVDTGSTDRTVELAKKAGAKIFSFPWTDDFAAAKNYALEQAKGDWIAFLDADEYLMPEDAKKLYNVLKGLPAGKFDGISTGCLNLDDEGNISSSATLIRFFRNTLELRYRRRIHEQLESINGRELYIGDLTKDISIFHTGYQRKVLDSQAKKGRNRRLILKELEDHPKSCEMLGYMGDECVGDGDYSEAETWYRQAVKYMPSQLSEFDQRSAVTFSKLLKLLAEREGAVWEDLKEIHSQAVKLLPQEADFDYIVARFFASQGQAKEAIRYLETAIKKLDTYGCNNKALLLAGDLLAAYDLLVRCCYEAEERQKCVSYGVTYLKYNKYGMAVLSRILKTLLSDERTEQETEKEYRRSSDKPAESKEYQAVAEFFAQIYDFSSLKDRLFLVKTAQKSDCSGFAAYSLNHFFTLEERSRLGI